MTMTFAALLAARLAVVSAGGVPCKTDMDCSLNGLCTDGVQPCRCPLPCLPIDRSEPRTLAVNPPLLPGGDTRMINAPGWVVAAGACVCDPGWTTLPFGAGGSMAPGCGYLDFLPSPTSQCGPACAFHGGVSPGPVRIWSTYVHRCPGLPTSVHRC